MINLATTMINLIFASAIFVVAPTLAFSACNPAIVDLKTAKDYSVLAGSTITNSGLSTITGKVGVSPGTAITGVFSTGDSGSIMLQNSQIDLANGLSLAAKSSLYDAYGATAAAGTAAGECTVNTVSELGGLTLPPGIYKSTAAMSLTDDVTLLGGENDVWIFQMGSTFVSAVSTKIILGGDAKASNVFWQVGSSGTLGASSSFVGTMMAYASITLGKNAIVKGRVLARTAAVTMLANDIISPSSSDGVDNDNDNDNCKNINARGIAQGTGLCTPECVDLADFEVWDREKGYWVGEYTFLGPDGKPFTSLGWPYRYDSYKGFIILDVQENQLTQRNVFVYPPSDSCATIGNQTIGSGKCGVNGNEKIFLADQTASNCEGGLAGPYEQYGTTFDTKTTPFGDNSVLYQVSYRGILFQNQLTSLPSSTSRVRTAQSFDYDGTSTAASYFRETKVDEATFYQMLAETRAEYNILAGDYCGNDQLGSPSVTSCDAHFGSLFQPAMPSRRAGHEVKRHDTESVPKNAVFESGV